MKINTKLWLTIIIISLIIIVSKSFNISQKKNYFFERNFVKVNNLKSIKISILDSINNHDFINATNNIITVYNKKQIDNNIYRIDIYDISKNKIMKSFETSLPTNSISYIKDSCLVYIDKFILFSKNIIDNKISNISNSNCKIYNAFPLANKKEYIFLGESKINNITKVGFFKSNIITKKLTIIKEIKTGTIKTNKNFLIYTGIFSTNSNYITYTSNKTSNVFIFGLSGNLVNHIKTKENVPNPEIIEFNNTFGYKRGFTFSTNIATFIKKDDVYILSERVEKSNNAVVDKYSLTTGEYLSSFNIKSINTDNQNINNIFQMNDTIIFNSNYKFISYINK
jgi:hypothetical protein